MPSMKIKNHRDGSVIYDGHFKTLRECVEQAVIDRVALDYADLKHANLEQANLDGITLNHAHLAHSNLTGANLSEAQMTGTSFYGSSLCDAVFCESELRNCDFSNAHFGATDLYGATINATRFSGLSSFSLNFSDAIFLSPAIYKSTAGTPCTFSAPPICLKGMKKQIFFFDRMIKVGLTVKEAHKWTHTAQESIVNIHNSTKEDENFFYEHMEIILSLFHTHTQKLGYVPDLKKQAG